MFKLCIIKFVFFTGILSILIGCQNSNVQTIQSEIDNITIRLVPDQRIGICTIIAKPGTKGSILLAGETTNSNAKREIIKTLNDQGIKLIDSIIILPDTIMNEKFMGLATLSVINLRKQPDHKSELVSQAILGTPLLILKDKDSWLLIQTPDLYIAWTEKSSVKMMNRLEMNAWKKTEKVIYVENSGWIYNSTGDSGVVGDLVAGSIMERLEDSASYVKVMLPDGRKGFVNKKLIIDFEIFRNQSLSDGESIIRRASSLLGVPYLWGGSSSKGVDCSGFVQTVFFMNGVILMRDASLQALHGDKVDISNGFSQLKKGDLLFFGSKDKSKSHVTHVAIYKGDNEYINSSGRVMISSLDSTDTNFNKYRLHSLLAAIRIIGVANAPGIVPVNKHLWY